MSSKRNRPTKHKWDNGPYPLRDLRQEYQRIAAAALSYAPDLTWEDTRLRIEWYNHGKPKYAVVKSLMLTGDYRGVFLCCLENLKAWYAPRGHTITF